MHPTLLAEPVTNESYANKEGETIQLKAGTKVFLPPVLPLTLETKPQETKSSLLNLKTKLNLKK